MTLVPFNKPYLTGDEHRNLVLAQEYGQLSGDGSFTKLCSEWIEKETGTKKALLTHSCTAALEMAAILTNIQLGDEVIMPSYTFVSTANAFVLRGAVPVFIDIRSDTLNIDESLIEQAITTKTKAIVAVHYAGVACEMDTIMRIAEKYGLVVIEDAAQAVMANYKGRALGTIGHFGCYSFHETKNLISGEGGALLINSPDHIEHAEIIREKGTNRSRFLKGQVDKYTWVGVGSSYLPGEIISAFLWAQMQQADLITERRLNIWSKYHESFEPLEKEGKVRRPIVPEGCEHNAHMYYLLLENLGERTKFIDHMKSKNILCVFHYVPLHDSPQGIESCRVHESMTVTNKSSSILVRLPLWLGVEQQQQMIIESALEYFSG